MSNIKMVNRGASFKKFFSISRKSRWAIFILSIILLVLSLFLPIQLETYSIPTVNPSREYKVGELSDETILSPLDFSYTDKEATEALQKAAVEGILPEFTFSMSESIKVRTRLDEFLSLFSSGSAMTADEFLKKYELVDSKNVMGRLNGMGESVVLVITRLISEGVVKVMDQGLAYYDDINEVSGDGWENIVVETSSGDGVLTRKQRSVDDILTKQGIPQYILSWISNVYPNTKGTSIDLISDGVELLSSENIFYDRVLTEALIQSAKESVTPVQVEVKKGDELLSVDKIVTSQMLKMIEEINSKATIKISFPEIVGRMFYVVTLIVMFLYIFISSIPYKYRIASYTMIVLVSVTLIFVVSFFWLSFLLEAGLSDVDAILPFFILPLLVAAITNNKTMGVMVGVFYAALQNTWPTSSIYSFFYIVTSCVICVYFIRFNNDRLQVLIQSVESAGAVAVVTFVFALLEHLRWQSVLISLLGSIANVLIAHLVLSILLPVFERVFNIPTGYRLHELSYTDTPALNRLNQVALGTYNHVKNVSDMAYAAAKAIGGNAELARVGALYHDIGKSEHPEYFVENQTGKNAHDDISSTLSAAIIKSHVKIGVEKAKEIGLPQEVIDIIGEHHGNDLIKYFYNEAVKNNKLGSTVSEEDFRYSGRIPSTPESAIVMLADCVEAATRTIKNPTHQKYEKFISNIITDKISYKQLDNSQLTLTDLDNIKQSFIHQLMGRDHHRIEYDNK